MKQDEVEQLKQDQGVVMVESRAAHLQSEEEGEKAEEGDLFKLSAGKKKKRRKASDSE